MGEHWSYDWVVSDKDWVFVGDVWERELKVLMGSPRY